MVLMEDSGDKPTLVLDRDPEGLNNIVESSNILEVSHIKEVSLSDCGVDVLMSACVCVCVSEIFKLRNQRCFSL